LARAGISVVSVANNHALDCGRLGLQDELTALDKTHVKAIGLAGSHGTVVVRKGVRIGLLAYCDFPNDSGGPGICYTDEKSLSTEIRALKRRSDVVAVFWHWGNELQTKPNPRQRFLARLAASAGADVVIGCHPHVLQPIERVGRTVVAYSLGNFVFDAAPGARSLTEILHVYATRRGVVGYKASPYKIVRCRAEPANGSAAIIEASLSAKDLEGSGAHIWRKLALASLAPESLMRLPGRRGELIVQLGAGESSFFFVSRIAGRTRATPLPRMSDDVSAFAPADWRIRGDLLIAIGERQRDHVPDAPRQEIRTFQIGPVGLASVQDEVLNGCTDIEFADDASTTVIAHVRDYREKGRWTKMNQPPARRHAFQLKRHRYMVPRWIQD
jgi:hypothetical protein